MKSKKILSIIMIVLMVVFVARYSYAAPLDLNTGDGAEDLTSTLTPSTNSNSSTNENSSLNTNTNTNTSTNTNTNTNASTNQNANTDTNLPNTGIEDTTILIAIVAVCAVVGVIAYKKMKYYADI